MLRDAEAPTDMVIRLLKAASPPVNEVDPWKAVGKATPVKLGDHLEEEKRDLTAFPRDRVPPCAQNYPQHCLILTNLVNKNLSVTLLEWALRKGINPHSLECLKRCAVLPEQTGDQSDKVGELLIPH